MTTRNHNMNPAPRALLLSLCVLTIAQPTASALDLADVPASAPRDAIMASPSEVQEVQRWAATAFAPRPSDSAPDAIRITVRRQDFNTLHFGESCMETPIRIGDKAFEHGLGTHANSEIVVTLPSGAARFAASIGVDNNYDTQGTRGSVQFAVVLGGKEVFRSPTLKGSDGPLPVDVALPAGQTELLLKVDTTADGPGWDQSDWADARLIMADGSTRWLDENRSKSLLADPTSPPFSFDLGGKPSSAFLKSWKHSATTRETDRGAECEATWEDPATGLTVTAVATTFKDYPAVDWLLYFENRGKNDTPIIENIRTADLQLGTGNGKRPVVLHQLHGDSCNETTFTPFDTTLAAGGSTRMAPARGRPSQETAFPFWNLQYRDQGVITAIGWSGQWSASYTRTPSDVTRFEAGMEQTHLLLHPGEKIRTPRVLLMPWSDDLRAAHNRFRRLMLFRYVPQLDGRPLRLPTVLQTFDRYISRPDWATEAGQLQAVDAAHKIGFDAYWFDAGWFPGGFPAGVGNWTTKPKEFPNGLKPISDRCHKYGMPLILWFEPCRVAPGTQIAREHPQFVLGDLKRDGLFNLGDPQARAWLTELISQRITEFGVDIYREDYNIDPLDFWRGQDAPDRQGMTEIKFVEGHYLFWDALRKQHPGLWIDNCASGGRRIDLETCMRSVPLWRSDTNCSPGHLEWNQQQSAALSQYLPLHTASAWDSQRYVFRSSGTGGLLSEADYLNPTFPLEATRAMLAEIKENAKYWYGDFYPLTQVNTALDQFAAFQLHRPDLDAGIVMAFRRPQCDLRGIIVDIVPAGSMTASPEDRASASASPERDSSRRSPQTEPEARGSGGTLRPNTSYRLEFIDEAGHVTTQTRTGSELKARGLELQIPAKGESLLVRYSAVREK
jgi:alpha-galactosidase